jgi:ABC-type transport system involved in cytochrome bd biosynthesis fused ATPase/permease subunit
LLETLLFVSRLKVSPCQTSSFYVKDKSRSLSSLLDNTSSYDRLVENVAMELGLIESIDALIGNESMGVSGEGGGKKGLSGGERRRVSIAVQLLTNPQGKSSFSLALYC